MTCPSELTYSMYVDGALPAEEGGADELGLVGDQGAGQAGHRAGDHEAGQLVTEGRKAERLHAPLVVPRAHQHPAEARGD